MPRRIEINPPWRPLELKGSYRISGWSALDYYYRRPLGSLVTVLYSGDLGALAAEGLPFDYPGADMADALWLEEERNWLFLCHDEEGLPEAADRIPGGRLKPYGLIYDPARGAFQDFRHDYRPLLRSKTLPSSESGPPASWHETAAEAVMAGRFGFSPSPGAPYQADPPHNTTSLLPCEQRWYLTALLEGDHPRQGLEVLHRRGFIRHHWPEVAELENVKQSKWDHPEGNALEHTFAALEQQKSRDPLVGLALLLHDLGKTKAPSVGANHFHGHAQLGAAPARRFLKRLEISAPRQEEILFLVKNHMLPAFIPTLPFSRTEGVLTSPLMPRLLEVYRCDLTSTFRDPAAYYEACRTYKRFLKKSRRRVF